MKDHRHGFENGTEPTRSEMLLKFKALFETQRADILATHGFVDHDLKVEKDDMLDEADWTATELASSMKMRLRNREALYLRKINEALDRIRDGSFGLCQECGDDIELRRIEARPTASLCVFCKEEQEKMESLHIESRKPKSLGVKLRLA